MRPIDDIQRQAVDLFPKMRYSAFERNGLYWTFHNTPFNVVYSYMKHTNAPSYKTAISYGCKQVDEYKDEVNEITKVFAITREEWINR